MQYIPPCCPTCSTRLLRWSWFEQPKEPLVYWYCLACDLRGVEPCIHALRFVDMIQIRRLTTKPGRRRLYSRLYVFVWRKGRGHQIYTTLRCYLRTEAIDLCEIFTEV